MSKAFAASRAMLGIGFWWLGQVCGVGVGGWVGWGGGVGGDSGAAAAAQNAKPGGQNRALNPPNAPRMCSSPQRSWGIRSILQNVF